MEPTTSLQMHGATALVTLMRPPANALNHALLTELVGLLRKLHEPAVRSVVLTGQGRFFSAGLDLFDRFQLANVIAVCREHRSLSEAGRRLFAVSRLAKASSNDADRLKKYLARFGLSWDRLAAP